MPAPRRLFGTLLAAVVAIGCAAGGTALTHGHPLRFISRQWNGFSHQQTTFSSRRTSSTSAAGDTTSGASRWTHSWPTPSVGSGRTTSPTTTSSTGAPRGALLDAQPRDAPAGADGPDRLPPVRRVHRPSADAGRPRAPPWPAAEPHWLRRAAPAGRWLIHGSVGLVLGDACAERPGAGLPRARDRLSPPSARPRVPSGAAARQATAERTAEQRQAGDRRPWPRPSHGAVGGAALLAGVIVLGLPYLSVREVSLGSDAASVDPRVALSDLAIAADLNPLTSVAGRLGRRDRAAERPSTPWPGPLPAVDLPRARRLVRLAGSRARRLARDRASGRARTSRWRTRSTISSRRCGSRCSAS